MLGLECPWTNPRTRVTTKIKSGARSYSQAEPAPVLSLGQRMGACAATCSMQGACGAGQRMGAHAATRAWGAGQRMGVHAASLGWGA